MDDFDRLLKVELKDPEFKKEWEATEPEYQIEKAVFEARTKLHTTQKELSRATGIPQADISRIEHGNANPRLDTLKRLADGLGMVLNISFTPKQANS